GFQTDHADQAGSLRAGGAMSPPHRQRLWECGWRGVPRECMALDLESGSPRSLSFLRVLPINLLTRPCIAEPNASGSESRDSDPDAGLTHSRTRSLLPLRDEILRGEIGHLADEADLVAGDDTRV